MTKTIWTMITILSSYILAAPLTSLISLDLTLTVWTNILTYVIWAFAIPLWTLIGLVIVLIIGGFKNPY